MYFVSECSDIGGRCVHQKECALQLEHLISDTKHCEDGAICCLTGQKVHFKTIDSYNLRNDDAAKSVNASSVAEIAEPEAFHSNPSYSLDVSPPDGLEEIRIVNMKVDSNKQKPKVVPKKVALKDSPEESDENMIVFPETSEEKPEDRVQYIKKLYKKFALDFKKYNYQKDGQFMSKRKLKYTVGYKSAKCK